MVPVPSVSLGEVGDRLLENLVRHSVGFGQFRPLDRLAAVDGDVGPREDLLFELRGYSHDDTRFSIMSAACRSRSTKT
jgi:hypothetical protein